MDYKEKYEQGLECIQEILSSGQEKIKMTLLKERLLPFFPELKESEDELTWLTKFIEEEAYSLSMDIRDNEDRIKLKNLQKSLAWLEKQGESGTFDVPQTPIKDAVEVTSRMQYISDDMKPIAEFIMGYANWDLHKDEWNQPTLTVPLFRVLDALIQRGKPYGECNQNIEKQGEHQPTWSEEDDAYKLFAISAVEDYYDVKNPLQKALVDWLKSLKERLI